MIKIKTMMINKRKRQLMTNRQRRLWQVLTLMRVRPDHLSPLRFPLIEKKSLPKMKGEKLSLNDEYQITLNYKVMYNCNRLRDIVFVNSSKKGIRGSFIN